jgi:putative FmdB family regulatory protein
MPFYDFQCEACRRRSRLFYTYAEYDTAVPQCRHCGSSQLKRLISRVALAKSEDARLEAMADDTMLAGLDEEDPRSLGRFMRKMSSEMGEDLGDEFSEVVDRLESGESPDDIEKSMPELAEGGSDGFPDD